MALIICPECGKEISNKAPACINCGCPVSAMKAEPVKTAASVKQNNSVDFKELFGECFDGKPKQKAAPMKTVPTERPELRMFPGIIVNILNKFCGICTLAGFMAIGSLVVSLLNGELWGSDFMTITFLGIPAGIVLNWLSTYLEFSQVRKFLKKDGYEESIRNDMPPYTNSANAYRLYPSMLMAKYIKRLKPVMGDALVKALKQNRAKKRKSRMRYLPYLLILVIVYYLVPRFEDVLALPYESSLIVCHVVTAVVMFACGRKQSLAYKLIVVVAVLFAPVIFAYFYSDMWYHILICAATAFAGMMIGNKTRKK